MKVLALTDIHGEYDLALTIIQKESADVVIIGGDLTTIGSVKEAEHALHQFRTSAMHVLCVAGNMDLPQHDDLFVKLGCSLNGRGTTIDGTGFFGVSAAPHSPLHTPYEISEEEIATRIAKGFEDVKNVAFKVFVPHAPPYGTKVDIIHAGFHVGSTAVREFIEDEQPDVVICGHIHEARGQDVLGKTKIVNCGTASHGYYSVINIQTKLSIKNLHHS